MQLPSTQVTRAVIQRYARLRRRYAEDLGVRPLVVPNGSFFPDRFTADAASLERITRRMQAHAGMRDIPIRAEVIGTESGPASSSCSSGACGVPSIASSGQPRLVDDVKDGWRIQVPEAELRHPIALTTNLARSLAFIFLVETQNEGELLEPPVDVTADLIAVALGFGPLMLQGAYIYAKSCSGPQVASVTKIKLGELAIAVAVFAALDDHALAPALKELDATQRAALTEAQDLMRANRALLETLAADPLKIADGHFELEAPGSFLSNWMKRRRQSKTSNALDQANATMDLDEVEALLISMPPSSSAGRPRLKASTISGTNLTDAERAELNELVSDALRAARVGT